MSRKSRREVMSVVKAADFAKAGCKYLDELYSKMDCQKFFNAELMVKKRRGQKCNRNLIFRANSRLNWTK